MVRSYWKGALVLTLAWAGVARGQQVASRPLVASAPDGIVTVQEAGKPTQRCRILSSWSVGDGNTAYMLKSLDTGETSMIVDGPTASKVKLTPAGTALPTVVQASATQSAPAATPPGGRLEPIPAGTMPMPAGGGSGCDCASGGTCASSGGEYRTVQESGRPPMRLRILRRWRTDKGQDACQCQCADNGEMVTVVQTGPATAVQGAPPGSRLKAIATQIFHWGRNRTPPPGCPLPPPVEVIVQAPPTTVTPLPLVVSPRPTNAIAIAQPTAVPARPLVAFTGPDSWRQSWGGSEAPKVAARPVETKPSLAIAQAPVPAAVVHPLPAPPASVTVRAPAPPPPVPVAAQMPSRLPAPPAASADPQKGSDPLTDPGSFASRRVVDKMPGVKGNDPQGYSKPFTPPTPVQTAAARPVPPSPQPATGGPSVSTSTATPQEKMPLGAASVLAASNGIETPVRYVPMPIVTQPERRPPPLPPVPDIPQAPQPNAKFMNAFSPTEPPGGQQGMPPQGAPMMAGGMVPGYAPMGGYPGMAQGYPPMMYPARYPAAAYPAMMPQRPMGYGSYPMAQGPYPGMQPMMVPQYPYYPMGQPMPMGMPSYPPARGNVPYAYRGPLPPNPFPQQTVMPAGYAPNGYPMPGWAPPQGFNAVMDRRGPANGPTVAQSATADAINEMLNVLKTSSYPSQREWAANNLATFDPRGNPQVVQALVAAAKNDPAPTVRAGCVYTLARMKANADPVLATLRELKRDTDPRVRHEADQALARLTPAHGPSAEQNAVQPASAVVPR